MLKYIFALNGEKSWYLLLYPSVLSGSGAKLTVQAPTKVVPFYLVVLSARLARPLWCKAESQGTAGRGIHPGTDFWWSFAPADA